MNINDFTAWHQVFIGLNLAYAGSKDFRIYINEISDKVKNLVVLSLSIHTRIYTRLLNRIEDKNVQWQNKFEKTKGNFENSEKFIRFNSLVEKDFTNIFKPFFFIASILGFFLLFLCGAHTKIEETLLLKCIYLTNFSLLIYGTIIFIFSFIRNKIDKPINIFINIPLLVSIFVLGIISFNFISKKYLFYFPEPLSLPFLEFNTLTSSISVALPLLLFFIRKGIQFITSFLYLAYILLYGCFSLLIIQIIIFFAKLFKAMSEKIDKWFDK